jgi:hypothetical protein
MSDDDLIGRAIIRIEEHIIKTEHRLTRLEIGMAIIGLIVIGTVNLGNFTVIQLIIALLHL